METKIELGKKYRVIGGENAPHFFSVGEIVTCVDLLSDKFVNENGLEQHVPAEHLEPTDQPTLPTWCDLAPIERHTLLGKLIDAMIYSGVATDEVKTLVQKFERAGYVRSTILPPDAEIDEPLNLER